MPFSLRPDIGGRYLYNLGLTYSVPQVSQFYLKSAYSDFRVAEAATMAALAAYRLDHGRYPKDGMRELVPAYLPKIPFYDPANLNTLYTFYFETITGQVHSHVIESACSDRRMREYSICEDVRRLPSDY